MNKITLTQEMVLIEYKRFIPFIKEIKLVTKKILLKDIKFVTREEYQGELKSLVILMKKGNALSLLVDKYENLEEIYSLFIKYHSKQNDYEVSIIDVYYMKETKVC